MAAHCTDSTRTSKADCEAVKPNNNGNPYGVWLAEGAECEAILLNTAANDGDANIPDCGDVVPGQVSPKGSPVNPHIITTYAELKTMRNDLSAHYKLGGNIDASASWEEGAENCDAYTGNGELPTGTPCTGWVPVGDATTQFTGSLDGAGYTINDLYVYVKVTSGTARGGLFGYAGGRAEIRNLGLTDVYVNVSASATSVAGALVGINMGTIMNSYATGEVTADSSSDFSSSDFFQDSAGGLVGISYGAIMNSYATGDVTANSSAANKNAYGGGLVGQSYGTIMNSYATGDVEANSSRDTVSGGLSGRNAGTIMNSYATGDVEVSSSSGSSSYGGGLVGLDRGGTITNSYATGDVEATSTSGTPYGGGLVGWTSGTITNSYATGDVEAESTSGSSFSGGLVGWFNGTITNSYATGDVEADSTVNNKNSFSGGLVGLSHGTISNSYARGDVTATATASSSLGGGLVGWTNGKIINSYATGNVTTSSNSGSSLSGGLVARNDGGSITGTNYFVANHGGTNGLGGGTCTGTCERRTLTQLAALTSVTGWAASDWHFSVTTHLPRLKYAEVAAYCTDSSKTTQAACEAPNSANSNNPFGAWLAEGAECEAITPPASNTSANDGNPNTPDCGDVLPWPVGSPLNPYIITTYAELKTMRNDLTAHYKLGANIDASASWGEGASGCAKYTGNGELPSGTPCTGWEPVGSGNSFTGSLDGGGHTISNLYVYVKRTSGTARGGLFEGTSSGAQIKNLGLTDIYVNVSSSSSSSYGGGLAGWNFGTIMNSYATGDVNVSSSSSDGGGLAGWNFGTIMNSYATGDVTAGSGGGLVGISHGIITNSYATGDVTAGSGGGLVGFTTDGYNTVFSDYSEGTISNSYATGDVNVSSSGGGLVGEKRSTISNSYAAGNVGCKAGGTCTLPKFGGLVGENHRTITGTNYFVYNGAGNANDDGVGSGLSCANTVCIQATGATAALRLTWMRDTLNEATAFTTQAGTSPAYTAWDAASWADMNKVGGFPKLKYGKLDAFCSNSSYMTKATCVTRRTWLPEAAECEVITPSSDNTAANNGDPTIPDCGDLIPGQ